MSLLKVRAWEHLQHLLDAAPARPGPQLRQPDAEGSVAAVHVGDVVGVLRGSKAQRNGSKDAGEERSHLRRVSYLLVGVLHPQLQRLPDGGVVVPRAGLRLEKTHLLQVVESQHVFVAVGLHKQDTHTSISLFINQNCPG